MPIVGWHYQVYNHDFFMKFASTNFKNADLLVLKFIVRKNSYRIANLRQRDVISFILNGFSRFYFFYFSLYTPRSYYIQEKNFYRTIYLSSRTKYS